MDKGMEYEAIELMEEHNVPYHIAIDFIKSVKFGDYNFSDYNKHYHNIKHILDNKGKIHAIKEFRGLTGNSLKHSKRYVEAIEHNLIKHPDWIPEELWEI